MIICYTVRYIWHVTHAIFIFHFGFFLPFYPLPAKKIKRMKKTPGDITILHMCTKNYDLMMYGS